MRTELLEEFVVWAENKTVESAARQIHISQSTLSKHLIALESELGVNLVNRRSKGKLTPAGVHFYNGAVSMLDCFNRTLDECKRLEGKSRCEIVVWDPFVFSGAMNRLERIMRKFPKSCDSPFNFSLKNEPYKTSREALEEGLVDVAIEYHPLGIDTLEVLEGIVEYPLMEEPLIVWCKKSHRLAQKEKLLPSDLEGVPIMCSMELPHPLQQSIVRLCEVRGFSPRFYRFNPVSQADFFFDAPSECVYIFTPELENDERIRPRSDMRALRFDDDDFAVQSYIMVRRIDNNKTLEQFCDYLSDTANR